nr:hypothetical protein [Cognatishimia sp. F0-27]
MLVASLIAMPAMLIPETSRDTIQIVGLFCVIGALLTFSEYFSSFPSIIEFREAAPFNRVRFGALFSIIVSLALVLRGLETPTPLTGVLIEIGRSIGTAADMPFSPIRLMVLAAPETVSAAQIDLLHILAGLAFLIALVALTVFILVVRILNWPIRRGAFNFWVNLPLFDPTAGGDILTRLRRDAHINVSIGVLLPFLIPAMLKLFGMMGTPFDFFAPQTLIWTIAAWAFLPTSLIMRGVALMRIADLIALKRRRAYAEAALQAV